MSLADIQLQNKLEEIIKESLQKGCYPELDVVLGKILEWQKQHHVGDAQTLPPKLVRREISSSQKYNDFFQKINSDIQCLYQQLQEIYKQLQSEFTAVYNQTEYLSTLFNCYSNSNDIIGDTFADYSKIDLDKTTAVVDLRTNEVRLDETLINQKLDLSNIDLNFTVGSEFVTYDTLSPLSNISDDLIDTYWLTCIKSPTPDAISGELVIDIGASTILNKLEITFCSFIQYSEVYISNDGINWEKCTTISPGIWFLPDTKIRWIKLIMQKSPDEKKDMYCFYFGISNLSIYKTNFVESNEFVSKPFYLDVPIVKKISLDVDVEKPLSTDLKYYINFNDDIWMPIENDLNLSIAPKNNVSFEQVEPYKYNLYKLSPGVAVDNLWLPELNIGMNKYLKMRAYSPKATPFLDDWNSIPRQDKVAIYCDKNSFFDTKAYANDNLFYYQFYINLDKDEERWVQFSCIDNCSFSIYLNGALVPVVGIKALLHLIKGINEVVVLINTTSDNALKWNWPLTDKTIFTQKQTAELVDYSVLKYQVPPVLNNYYSLINQDGLYYPVINFNPANYNISPQNIIFKYCNPYYNIDSIRFKAVLSRASGAGQITPRLKKYSLSFEGSN